MDVDDFFSLARTKVFRRDVVVDGSREVLRCPILKSANSGADKYRSLADHLGLDFSQIAEVLDHLPVFQDGGAHSQLRVDLAKLIAKSNRGQDKSVTRAARRFTRLDDRRNVDLVRDIIKPSVDILFTNLVGLDLSLLDISDVSLVLADGIGIRKRRAVEEQLRKLDTALRGQFPDAADREILLRKMLVVMGHDATIASTALSLLQLIMEHPGKLLSEIPYPDTFVRTGVPFVRRTVTDDLRVGDLQINKSQDVSVLLSVFDTSSAENDKKLFFGHGRHVCLGAPLSLRYWRSVTHVLSGINRTGTIVKLEEKPSTAIRTPQRALIEMR
jgi:hypothetical protein